MTYTVFRRLCSDLAMFENHYDYLQESGYVDWMDEFVTPGGEYDSSRIVKIAEYLYRLTKMDIKEIQTELGFNTMYDMSVAYDIPYRTIQYWGKNDGPVEYEKMLIAYTAFQKFLEGK